MKSLRPFSGISPISLGEAAHQIGLPHRWVTSFREGSGALRRAATGAEGEEALVDYGKEKLSGRDSQLFELYTTPGLFGQILENIFNSWQQNGCIPRSMSRGLSKRI